MNREVKVLCERAQKYGAPNKEALCLAISRVCCEQCQECDIRDGGCKGIWAHEGWLDYAGYTCIKFNRLDNG